MSKPDEHCEIGGARYGQSYWRNRYNWTWPFGLLGAGPDFIEVSAGFWPFRAIFRFANSEVRRLSIYKGLISTGLQIEHDQPNYPPVHRILDISSEATVSSTQSTWLRCPVI